ncbi:hypothetical protein RRG08_001423 [Elysia crispata]|uniref:Uncharacterized protein n=1 Tax=Elysia crispata TaxID=231223 RepID=A0AAE0ZQF7_9GAST|nr:hypothetical protein RRG08_001423 [Elysia crispata]
MSVAGVSAPGFGQAMGVSRCVNRETVTLSIIEEHHAPEYTRLWLLTHNPIIRPLPPIKLSSTDYSTCILYRGSHRLFQCFEPVKRESHNIIPPQSCRCSFLMFFFLVSRAIARYSPPPPPDSGVSVPQSDIDGPQGSATRGVFRTSILGLLVFVDLTVRDQPTQPPLPLSSRSALWAYSSRSVV